MRMATERSNNTDFDHACLSPHFYLRPSHVCMIILWLINFLIYIFHPHNYRYNYALVYIPTVLITNQYPVIHVYVYNYVWMCIIMCVCV